MKTYNIWFVLDVCSLQIQETVYFSHVVVKDSKKVFIFGQNTI